MRPCAWLVSVRLPPRAVPQPRRRGCSSSSTSFLPPRPPPLPPAAARPPRPRRRRNEPLFRLRGEGANEAFHILVSNSASGPGGSFLSCLPAFPQAWRREPSRLSYGGRSPSPRRHSGAPPPPRCGVPGGTGPLAGGGSAAVFPAAGGGLGASAIGSAELHRCW